MPHVMRSIRDLLGVTQLELSGGIDCGQSNIAKYERGQTIPPDVARRLIDYAATLGVALTYDQVYGGAKIPQRVVPRRQLERV